MVAEACQESGTLYTGNTYNGYGDIYHKNLSSGPYVSLCDITPPWGGTLTDELLTEDVPETYSSGAERYVITMHDAFIGAETKSAEFTECWWTEDGKRYVKPSGLNTALGNNWDNAWRTAGYGFQNIPSGKDLYVEEGYYGGETLSNLNPPQTMKMYIQPGSHTEVPTTVMISGDTLATNFTSARNDPLSWASFTYLQRSASIAANGTIYAFEFEAGASGFSGSIKFKILRLVGSNYEYVGGTGAFSYVLDRYDIVSSVVVDGIDVQSGDLIAIYISGATKTTYCTAGGTSILVNASDVTGTTPTSSWGDTSLSDSIGVKTYGI